MQMMMFESPAKADKVGLADRDAKPREKRAKTVVAVSTVTIDQPVPTATPSRRDRVDEDADRWDGLY